MPRLDTTRERFRSIRIFTPFDYSSSGTIGDFCSLACKNNKKLRTLRKLSENNAQLENQNGFYRL
jgi:hypothetical protein